VIIDIHSHIWVENWRGDSLWEGFANVRASRLPANRRPPLGQVKKEMLAECCDPTGEKQIKLMDEAGIDVAVLCSLDWGIALGEPPVPLEEQHERIAEIAQRFPGRYIPFAGVDPRREGAVELFEKCIREEGFRGLKLHPAAGFYPDDRRYYPLYEKAVELGVPVITHTGPAPSPLRSKPTQPVYLDDVLTDFPELTIVAAHMGQGWWEELVSMAHAKPNLMTDMSGMQPMAATDYERFCRILRIFLTAVGPDRVLFGTDGLVFAGTLSPKRWVNLIRELPSRAPEGITFTESEVEGILGGNARRLLGL